MEHSPPPFFKRGPAPFVRLVFFASLSITLLVLDARFRYVDGLRSMVAVVTYPLQRAALAPVELASSVAEYFTSQSALREQNAQLKSRLLAAQFEMQRSEAAAADAQRMRRNLESTKGLIFSGQLLLDLAAAGMLREQAYRTVQAHAMNAWETEGDFRALIEADKEVLSFLKLEQIERAFSVDRYLKHVDAIFRRIFG
mgnify:CR=1 FL=1